MATAGFIGSAGDVLVQRYERPQLTLTHVDTARTARVATYRVLQAPLLHIFWSHFDVWATTLRLSGGRAVAFKVVCDQALCSPFFNVSFYASQSSLEGRSLHECCKRVMAGFWPTWLAGFQYYGAVHCFTFSIIPPAYRIAWNSVAAVLWTAYLSHSNQTLISPTSNS